MPIKDKTKSLIIIRNTPYSGFKAFLQDVFYKDKLGSLANKAYELLKLIYKAPVPVKSWSEQIKQVFNVKGLSKEEGLVLDDLCYRHLGFHRENLDASKSRLRGRKPYQLMLKKHEQGSIKLTESEEELLKRVNAWHGAVASYYSIINKLKAIGLIDKREGCYQKSEKLKKRLSQLIDLTSGFENESK